MGYKIKTGRVKGDKPVSTFGKVKKPFKGKNKNRTGNKKESIFSHSRINKKISSKNNNRASSLDKEYLLYLHTLDAACFVCGKHNGIEWHHVKKYSSDKKDHTSLIPLCGVEHHRLGQELSPHGTPAKWRETYSMKEQKSYAKKFYDSFLAEKS